MNEQEIIHQAAIAGKVTDAQTGEAIQGALVSIVKPVPIEFQEWLSIKQKEYGEEWDTMVQRPDRKLTAYDGIYCFIDLPNGTYPLEVSMPGAGTRYGTAKATAYVSTNAAGDINTSVRDIALPPTTIKGRIINSDMEVIVMAEVRIKGSIEHAYSDKDGQYRICALEASNQRKRTVQVTARDYIPAEQSIWVYQPGIEITLGDFVLAPSIP